jgi:hypothetical protein
LHEAVPSRGDPIRIAEGSQPLNFARCVPGDPSQPSGAPLLYWRVYEPTQRKILDHRSASMSLGDRRPDLVPVAIPAAAGIFRREISSQPMTAWHTLGLCAALAVSVLLLCGAGAFLLRIFRVNVSSPFDTFLFSAATGAILLELAVSAGELAPNIRTGVRIAAGTTALIGFAGVPTILRALQQLYRKLLSLRGIERLLAALFLLTLALQGLASLAPLTGSDALHYHFPVQALYLAEGFYAPWSLLHGFFCGLSHELILAGLALGSGTLAQGWLFFGGALGALATLRLTHLWIGGAWPWLAALAFAVTPVAFWQTTAAGAPDSWLCAFLPLCLLAILQAHSNLSTSFIVLAGVLAGAIAGTKYTGIIFAAALLVGLLVAFWSAGRSLATKVWLFLACATAVGIWPYLRNWFWTGDPVFPFLFARMHHTSPLSNQAALTAIFLDTGASHAFSIGELIKFPLFAAVDFGHLGAWQLFGPLVVIFGPFAIWQFRKSVEGRIVLVVWFLGALGIGATSAMSRFLLPLLPIALAASIAGLALATQERWRALRALSLLAIGGFIFIGFAAMTVYFSAAWSVVAGRTAAEDYLLANSPDYQSSEFVNREVERLGQPGRALIFFHHLYYVRVPFFDGDPEDSWEMNPALLNSSAAWIRLFARHQIRWVLKSPKYPRAIADSLAHLENDGLLRPCASGEVESFSGNRIEGHRVREPITLYCVQGWPQTR